ncbi:amino acid/amide ABC transporter ATP-binding protein 2, HAAT family [Roseovarius pacificus]|uniref:Amino acid/amide ABC transporter ATP-binding protein 2, HAAT family n=1 Tax=Roseovarius pacificus TaxID=337701 RepID=A0A1M7GZT9_9RHOB|nr:ABC transporter ATP-binding protein [Roseovarius pacificus]GGO60081.1 ABC transporter ATP-binding protein [Roseovarius pacificus]SHM21437.1 amino acid/amide ABC transporter ATP-binding protein 2, HAAT family [Roseovarius pacificus]
MTSLTVENINVYYGVRAALRDVSLEVGEAEIVALIGSNGAGKTTTLRAIMGLTPPKSGRIIFGSRQISGLAPPSVVGLGITLSPEGRRVFPQMSVEENLQLGAYLKSDKDEISRTMERVYGYFPRLLERRTQAAGSMSGGEQQMLAIGRALMARPKLLLLDEPSLGLAPIRVQEIGKIIEEINREEGISIILVEQNANMALRLCQRAYVIESGAISLSGTGAELAASEHVRRAYLGG